MCAAVTQASPHDLHRYIHVVVIKTALFYHISGKQSPDVSSVFLCRQKLDASQITIESLQPEQICRVCNGEGSLPCADCGGLGRLHRGGYHKRNTFSMTRILGQTLGPDLLR